MFNLFVVGKENKTDMQYLGSHKLKCWWRPGRWWQIDKRGLGPLSEYQHGSGFGSLSEHQHRAVGLGTLTFLFRTGQPQMLSRCTYRNSCKQTVEVFQQRQTAYFRKNFWMLKLNRLEFHPALPLASWKILGDFLPWVLSCLPWVSQLQEADLIVYGKFSTVHNDAHIMVSGCWMWGCEMAEGN